MDMNGNHKVARFGFEKINLSEKHDGAPNKSIATFLLAGVYSF